VAAVGEELVVVLGNGATSAVRHSHAIINVAAGDVQKAEQWLASNYPAVAIMSEGKSLEIYKEVGYPDDVAKSFRIADVAGTHGISHTRMATESAVTTNGAHPFSTGPDQCLVHNGSLSNHASLRRELRREGIKIQTENDTEVAAAYLTRQMRDGQTLGEALKSSLDDLDGFFTFVVGTERGFGVLRDPIACKPAVMAETDRYVAFASEYKSLTCLPDIAKAKVWEPKPATVYFWEHA
jgi:glutamate synthase domain-containing protein 1